SCPSYWATLPGIYRATVYGIGFLVAEDQRRSKYVSMDDSSIASRISSTPELRFGKIDDLSSRAAAAIDAARRWLFSQQHQDGYWCGELEADTTLESDYILMHTVLGTGNQDRFQQAANYILRHQNEDGGWPIYGGGPSNISASVKAYFSLKLAGYKANHQ